ncbi:MAG: hypothetical protein ACKVGZ_20905, partial [Alphaproteobacteria bacterium]
MSFPASLSFAVEWEAVFFYRLKMMEVFSVVRIGVALIFSRNATNFTIDDERLVQWDIFAGKLCKDLQNAGHCLMWAKGWM